MQFSALFIAAALPFLISASPAERRSDSIERRSAAANNLAARGLFDTTPAGCTFAGRLGNAYIDNPTGDGDSCFGFDNGGAITCGGPYKPDEIANIKDAVREQATKDGQWKSTKKGDWIASFNLFTTAFEDRDTSAFDKTLDAVNVDGNSGAGQMTYYWQRKGDYITVSRSSCP
ncbi:MAG: hypothetical protein LQ349_009742 [Xanthoria aureola]|nr:MAG: hypothetical protein LQ349_009742 [Xanthoria aureola]